MLSPLVLASNSPRRRQLLALTGWNFLVRPVAIDEHPLPGEFPEAYVLRLAKNKARVAGQQAQPGQTILAADTTVAAGGDILGKPDNADEARSMLRRLQGREHTVYTAIGVCRAGPPGAAEARVDPSAELDGLFSDVCATRVWMRDYSQVEIEAYLASGDPYDKAGGYAIQNADFHPVARIEGCYSCVAGLPVCRVVSALARFGLTPPVDVTAGCPSFLETGAPCPVYAALLQIDSGGSQA